MVKFTCGSCVVSCKCIPVYVGVEYVSCHLPIQHAWSFHTPGIRSRSRCRRCRPPLLLEMLDLTWFYNLICKGILELIDMLTGVLKNVRNQILTDVFDIEFCFKFRWPEMFLASSGSPTRDAVFYHINILYVSINVFLLCECFLSVVPSLTKRMRKYNQ